MDKTKVTSAALFAAVAMMGAASPSAATTTKAGISVKAVAVANETPVLTMDENGMIQIAGQEANAALSTMYGAKAAQAEMAALDVNAYCPNKGCNTGNCVAGCGGRFA